MSIVLDRIRQQQNQNSVRKDIVFTKYIQPSISIDELQKELEKLFNIPEPIVTTQPKTLQDFPDLFHFIEWYLGKENLFTERQNNALKTLIEARDTINIGCACKRRERLNSAINYFKIFWTNNIKTDLISTVLKICQTERVKFGDFLQYP